MSKSPRSRSSKIETMLRPHQLFLAPGQQLAGRLVGHADDAVGRGHEHRVGHAAEHVGQVVLVDRGLAQLLAHALERGLQFAELIAPAHFQRPRVVALRDPVGALDERGDGLRGRGGPPTRRASRPDRQRDAGRGRRRAAAPCASALRCIASNCVRAAAVSGDISSERISTSTSPTVCGVTHAGHGLHVGAHRRDGAARDAAVAVAGRGARSRARRPRCRAHACPARFRRA